jgi:hypothetical protein
MHTVIIASTVPLFRSGLRIYSGCRARLRLVETTRVDETLVEAMSLRASVIIAKTSFTAGARRPCSMMPQEKHPAWSTAVQL